MTDDNSSYLSVSWLLSAVLTALSIGLLWVKSRRPYLKYNIPPFPVTPRPFVGHFFMIEKNLRALITKWRSSGGDLFSLDMAGQLHIVINGYDNLKEVLVNNADKVMNTQHLFSEDLMDEYDKGIFTARDDNWKEQRAVSLAIFRDFGLGKKLMADKIQDEVSDYTEKLAAVKGRPYDARDLTNCSVANVICSIIVGVRFRHDDPYFIRFMKRNNDFLQLLNQIILVSTLPILYYLPGDMFKVKRWVKCAKELNEMFAAKYIRELKEQFNENEEASNFIVAYLQELKKKKSQGKETRLDEKNLQIIIRTFFVAGTETTSTTISWCILYMLHYPKIQEKVYAEIEKQVGTERLPNLADKTKLKYLNAVIMETQRMASIIPVAERREVSSSFEVGGYTFPKGAVLWPCLDSVHYDKTIWGDPEVFRPERFIDSNGELLNPEEFVPFNIGKRACLGKGLAQMELFLFVSQLFQRFKIEPADTSAELPSTDGIFGASVLPQPFQARFIERMQ